LFSLALLKGVQTKIVDASHANWKQVERAYRAKDYNKVVELIDITRAITSKSNGVLPLRTALFITAMKRFSGYLFDRILVLHAGRVCHSRIF
jgi:hypothetical protein